LIIADFQGAAYPNIHKGEIVSISGCITNISHQKWAMEIQARKLEQAYETRRQQENFIDSLSHELR